jgi:quercetin dioxygenase-like cupin family protein
LELRTLTPTAKGSATTFTSDVYVNPIYRGEEPSRMIVSLVRFTPGARTNWHSHAVGQTVSAGHGGVPGVLRQRR